MLVDRARYPVGKCAKLKFGSATLPRYQLCNLARSVYGRYWLVSGVSLVALLPVLCQVETTIGRGSVAN